MWIATEFGFFSVVEKPDDVGAGTVTIRARVRGDLVALGRRYLPSLGPISTSTSNDYRHRAKASRESFAVALAKIALDLNYSNFKDAVAARQGYTRSKVYGSAWSALAQLGGLDSADAAAKAAATWFGGVVVDGADRVLLRKPKGELEGYVWTFAKGEGKGMAPEHAALGAVHRKTGYLAEVVARIPGTYLGGASVAEYFLMRPIGEPLAFDPETTQEVAWVPLAEAAAWLGETRNAAGRARDLAVWHAAISAFARGLRD